MFLFSEKLSESVRSRLQLLSFLCFRSGAFAGFSRFFSDKSTDIVTSDPYCKFGYISKEGEYVGDVKETLVEKNTLSPVWREETQVFSDFGGLPKLELTGDNDKAVGVRVEVWDWNKVTSHSFMGQAEFLFSSLKPSTAAQHVTLELKQKPGAKATTVKGSIVVGLYYTSAAALQAQKDAALAESKAREEQARKGEEMVEKMIVEYELKHDNAPTWMIQQLARSLMKRNLGKSISNLEDLAGILLDAGVFDKTVGFNPFTVARELRTQALLLAPDNSNVFDLFHSKTPNKSFKAALARWLWFLFDTACTNCVSAKQILDLGYLHHAKEPREVCEEYFRRWSAAGALAKEKLSEVVYEFFRFRLAIYSALNPSKFSLSQFESTVSATDISKIEYVARMTKVMLFIASGSTSSDGMTGLTSEQFSSIITSADAQKMMYNTHYGVASSLTA